MFITDCVRNAVCVRSTYCMCLCVRTCVFVWSVCVSHGCMCVCVCAVCTMHVCVYDSVLFVCVISLQVQDMYFANPPVPPNLNFYKEVFNTLVKYNDRCASEELASTNAYTLTASFMH